MLGASGGIGQPLSLLLKMHPLVTQLSLYDVVNTPGVAADLSHVDTPTTVTAHTKDAELAAALTGSDLVLIPAGREHFLQDECQRVWLRCAQEARDDER